MEHIDVAGIATNKSIGVNTSSLDDNDLQGIGASSVDTTITVTVGVDNVGGQSTGVFYLDGVEKPALFELNKRHTYIFDQSDNSNEVYGGANHPLMFSLGLVVIIMVMVTIWLVTHIN